MVRKINHGAIGLPVTFSHGYVAMSSEIALGVHSMLKSTDATRDMKCIVICNVADEATATIDGFALEPRGWPKLQELEIMRMDCALFPLRWQEPSSGTPFPALRILRLCDVPGLIDGQALFVGLAQMLQLRELRLRSVLFQKWTDSTAPPLLSLRLRFFSFLQKHNFDADGTADGWHYPISAPAAPPEFLQLLLNDADDLTPLSEDPSCLSDIIELSFLEEHRETTRCLPLLAYAGIPTLCPKLREINLFGPWDTLCPALAAMLATLNVSLRAVFLEFDNALVPTREALAEVDRTAAELLRTSQPMRRLRCFSITTYFSGHGILDIEFPALRTQCRSHGTKFDQEQ